MRIVDEINVAALKREIAVGIGDFDCGRYETYDDASLMQLAEDAGWLGRIRLNALRLKVAAKVQRKK